MSLAQALARHAPLKGPPCSMAGITAKLDPSDAALLAGALADKDVPGSQIAKALNDEGHKIGAPAVNRHRRGDCGCGTR